MLINFLNKMCVDDLNHTLDGVCLQVFIQYDKLKKQRLKITELGKACFIKVSEIKLTQNELF